MTDTAVSAPVRDTLQNMLRSGRLRLQPQLQPSVTCMAPYYVFPAKESVADEVFRTSAGNIENARIINTDTEKSIYGNDSENT